MNYQGELIYRERMRRNWSQEGLCRGICAVSYLSKIEKGKAEPSEEILRMLLERLELVIDPALEAEGAVWADTAYELLFSGCMEEFDELFTRQSFEKYRATPSGMDLLLLQQFTQGGRALEESLEACMNTQQLALQRLLQNRYTEAIALLPNAYCYYCAGANAYATGNDAVALEHLQTGYTLASQHGAPHLMLLCKLMIGNCYSNRRDSASMLKHYAVARRLATALHHHDYLAQMDYNIAASQMENGDFEEAYAYFSCLEQPSPLALHKLAICCEKTGRREQAFAALDRAKKAEIPHINPELVQLLFAVVRFRLEHANYLEEEEYGRLLLSCFEECRRSQPIGYALFHLPWVLEWYQATRQYKKAFELASNFPNSLS